MTFSAVKGMIDTVLEGLQPKGGSPGEIEFSGLLGVDVGVVIREMIQRPKRPENPE